MASSARNSGHGVELSRHSSSSPPLWFLLYIPLIPLSSCTSRNTNLPRYSYFTLGCQYCLLPQPPTHKLTHTFHHSLSSPSLSKVNLLNQQLTITLAEWPTHQHHPPHPSAPTRLKLTSTSSTSHSRSALPQPLPLLLHQSPTPAHDHQYSLPSTAHSSQGRRLNPRAAGQVEADRRRETRQPFCLLGLDS